MRRPFCFLGLLRHGFLGLGLLGLALWLATYLAACRPSDTGILTLRLWARPEDLAGFTRLDLHPEHASVNRGYWRDADRTPLEGVTPDLQITGEDVQPVTAAEGKLPAGRYDRVFVEVPTVTGRLPDGSSTPIYSHIEPIARGFDLKPDGHVTVDLQLIVLKGVTGSYGPWEIFVKDATLQAP